MTYWRIHVVCAAPGLDPFKFHEQFITVSAFPDLADALAGHYGHDIQAILVDRLSDDGAVKMQPPSGVHPVLWWRAAAALVGAKAALYPQAAELESCPVSWGSGHTCDRLLPHPPPHTCSCGVPMTVGQAAAPEPGAGAPGGG